MAYFPTVFAAGEAVFPMLDLKPTSLEIMDANFLTFVRKHNAKLDDMLPAGADTALLIEFEAADDAQLDEQLTSVESLLGGGAALQVKRALDAGEQKHLWAVRQAAVPLLQKLPGPKRIAEFIEDCTVHPEVLATYMHTLSGILKKYGVQGIMYGHAGDGNIHTRPILDLKSAGDLRLMQTILDEVVELVLGLKGTPSGEHGDGIVRSPYVRQVYGDEVYGIFSEIKDAFDPTGIINPGKKVVSKAEGGGVARNLRYGPTYYTHEQSPHLHFPAGEYEREIEKCHGCAQCRSLVGTTMCPTYKATRREHASPRAKANLLRNIISGRLDPTASYVADATRDVTDYCIECGMCVHECPSNVNIPKLMLEAKARYRSAQRIPGATDLLLGHATRLSQGGRLFSPVANRLVNLGPLRGVGERLVGIDRRRTMPTFARHTFAHLVAEQAAGKTRPQVAAWPAPAGAEWAGMPAPKVAFFYDLYVNYHDPGLGQTMENLLRAHGVDVRYPAQKASGIPEMLYGYWEAARDTARYNLDHALPHIHDGALLVSGEPTASFAFKAHYTDYVASEEASLAANATRDLGEFLVTLHGRPARARARAHSHRDQSRLPPALPPQGAAGRDALLRPYEDCARRGARQPGRGVLRHGRHLRHEESHLRPVDADRTAALRASGGRRTRPAGLGVQHLPHAARAGDRCAHRPPSRTYGPGLGVVAGETRPPTLRRSQTRTTRRRRCTSTFPGTRAAYRSRSRTTAWRVSSNQRPSRCATRRPCCTKCCRAPTGRRASPPGSTRARDRSSA